MSSLRAQVDFEDQYDHWAIDEVRVLHSLPASNVNTFRNSVSLLTQAYPAGWRSSQLWANTLYTAREQLQVAQCCFDTVECETLYVT
jgi:hypothetical protein